MKEVVGLLQKFSQQFGAKSLLMDLALGRAEVTLKDGIIAVLHHRGLSLQRLVGDRDELPVDFRFLDLLLRASRDPEVHLGSFAQGVKVGPGSQVASTVKAQEATAIAGETDEQQ